MDSRQIPEAVVIYKFEIPVKPVAKQSFRAIAAKKGTIHGFTPEHIGKNKLTIQKHIMKQLPKPHRMLANQVVINKLHFIFKRPETLRKMVDSEAGITLLKNTKPDLDNLTKQVLDSIKGLLISDDNIVSRMYDVAKFYGREDMIIIELEGN